MHFGEQMVIVNTAAVEVLNFQMEGFI